MKTMPSIKKILSAESNKNAAATAEALMGA